MINQYVKELKALRYYIVLTTAVIIISWSVYLLFDKNTVSAIGKEDGLFEWITAINFLIASLVFLLSFLKSRNYFLLLFAIIFFIGFGEEISWGFRLFNYELSEKLKETNVSGELNIHNIELFNARDFTDQPKTGIERMLEIEFLFKLFTILYGIILPLCVYHIKPFSRLISKIKFPVPPVSIGVLFLVNYGLYKILNHFYSPEVYDFKFNHSFVEIFESGMSFIFLSISLYFYLERRRLVMGKDIKQII